MIVNVSLIGILHKQKPTDVKQVFFVETGIITETVLTLQLWMQQSVVWKN